MLHFQLLGFINIYIVDFLARPPNTLGGLFLRQISLNLPL
jgi:hypothetical protein